MSLADAYYLVKKYEKNPSLTVVWPRELCCNIGYYEVFSKQQFSDIRIKVIEVEDVGFSIRAAIKGIHWLRAVHGIFARNKIKGLNARMRKQLHFIDYEPPKEVGWSGEEYNNWNIMCWEKLNRLLESAEETYVRAYSRLIMGEGQLPTFAENIHFKECFDSLADKIICHHHNIVGVHIRRTDHIAAIQNSPIESFYKKMEEILEEDSSTMFFLATDDFLVEQKIKEKFRKHIIIQPNKKWGRDERKEMESGIIDCLCLSKCKYVLGSYLSSFSSFSARLGGKELYICKGE
ncbi:MAG: hypothetical protein NC313_06935 [Butyrivibrio sp.]|nr:hypothetical protein [Butyrivibrio sp.]